MLKKLVGIVASLVVALGLMWLNYQMIKPQFSGEWTANLGSIEVSYIQMGQFIERYGWWGGYNPLWYFGYPMYLVYVPVLPMLEWWWVGWTGEGYGAAYRWITGMGYILAPAAVFWLGKQVWDTEVSRIRKLRKPVTDKNPTVSDRISEWLDEAVGIIVGTIAGLWYSVMPSVFAWLVPDVAGDRMTEMVWEPRRLAIWARWGEGPHTMALVWLPLAMGFSLEALMTGKRDKVVWAAVFGALTLLTNAIAVEALVVWWIILAVLDVGLLEKRLLKKGLGILLMSIILTGGLASWWYHPDFVLVFFEEAKGLIGVAKNLFPWGWVGLMVGLGVSWWLLRSMRRWLSLPLLAVMGWTGVMLGIVGVYYWSGEEKLELLPQALRLMTEADLGLGLVLALGTGWILTISSKIKVLNSKLWRFLSMGIQVGGIGVMILVCGLLVGYGLRLAPETRRAVEPYGNLDITNNESGEVLSEIQLLQGTKEYQAAQWVEGILENSSSEGEEWQRVVIPGNYGFYWNWFNEVPQLRGALFQASIHPWPDHIYYQLTNGRDGEMSRMWLEATETRYLLFGNIGTGELYNDFKKVDKEKFESEMERVAGLGGSEDNPTEILYRLREETRMARAVNADLMSNIRSPSKGDDKSAIVAYLNWVKQDSRYLRMSAEDNGVYKITGSLDSGQVVRVAMSWTSGWRAYQKSNIKNQKSKIMEDPLGFIVIEPGETGEVEIWLEHGVTRWQWIGMGATTVSVIVAVAWLIWGGKLGWEKEFAEEKNWRVEVEKAESEGE